MARKKAEIVTEGVEFEEGDVYEVDSPPLQDLRNSYEKKLDDLFESVSDTQSLNIAIYKQGAGGLNSGLQLCENVPADKYDYPDLQMYIKHTYGAGDYRLQVRVNGRLKLNELLSLAETVKKKNPESNSTGIDRVVEMMERQQERFEKLLSLNQNQNNDRMQFMQEMMMMKELFGNNTNNQGGIKEVFALLGGLKELGVNIGVGEEGGEKSGFLDFLGNMTEPLSKIVEASANNKIAEEEIKATQFKKRQYNAQRVKPTPRPNPIRPNYAGQQKKGKKDVFSSTQIINSMMRTIITAANFDKEPELYAEVVLDFIPEEFLEMVVNATDLPKQLTIYAPQFTDAIKKYRPWIERLHEAMKQILDEEEQASQAGSQDQSESLTPETDDVIDIAKSEFSEVDNADFSDDGATFGRGGDESHTQSHEETSESVQDSSDSF